MFFFFFFFVIQLNHSRLSLAAHSSSVSCANPSRLFSDAVQALQTRSCSSSVLVPTRKKLKCSLGVALVLQVSQSLQVRMWIQAPQTGGGLPRMHWGGWGGAFRALVEVGSRARITAGFSEPPQKKKRCSPQTGRAVAAVQVVRPGTDGAEY